MNVGIASTLLASVLCLSIAIAILLRRPKRPLYNDFAVLTAVLFLWHAVGLTHRLASGTLQMWQMGSALLIPPAFVLFFRELLRDVLPKHYRLTRTTTFISSLFLMLNFSPWGSSLWIQAPSFIYIIGTIAFTLQSLKKRIRSLPNETNRKRLKYVYYGGMVALLLGICEFFNEAEFLAALGHLAVTGYIYFLYQSIVSRRLIDIIELIGKASILIVLTFILTAVYAVFVVWVGNQQPSLWLLNTFIASFVILILYDQIKPWVEQSIARLLFRERHALHQSIEQLLRALRTTIRLNQMPKQVLDGLYQGHIQHVAIYLMTSRDHSFQLLGYRGEQPPTVLSMATEPSLFYELKRDQRPLLLDHLLHRRLELPTMLDDPTLQREVERTTEAIAAMRALHASVILPMLYDNQVFGLLSIGTEPVTDAFSTEEIASLLSLAEACAVVIENSYAYEKLRERDRLAAVGEMATGMAHEIRNPLGAIKGAAQCLEPNTLSDEAKDLIAIIVEEANRLNGVVSQFLEYARPYRGNPTTIDINHVIKATLQLVEFSVPKNIRISYELGKNLPLITFDPEQLKQVLLNILLNAQEAMPDGGTITIVSTQTNHALIIRIQDQGSGIDPQHLKSIFLPFFTTKTKGTGLGLAISQRMMQNGGGRIEVNSQQDMGTLFTLKFPLPTNMSQATDEQNV